MLNKVKEKINGNNILKIVTKLAIAGMLVPVVEIALTKCYTYLEMNK